MFADLLKKFQLSTSDYYKGIQKHTFIRKSFYLFETLKLNFEIIINLNDLFLFVVILQYDKISYFA